MKKKLLISVIMLNACVAHAQWTSQNLPLTYEGYTDAVKVVDANTIWGTTINGGTGADTRDFVRSVDGGVTWTQGMISVSPVSLRTSNIYPVDAQTCYAAAYNPTAAGGKVYKTTDGGTTWAQVGANMFTFPTSFANVVYFWDAQNGMAMGDPVGTPPQYEIYLTSDSGATWTQVPAANLPLLSDPAEYAITNLYDAVDGHVWYGTTYGDVYRSTDGGNTWTKSFTGLPAYVTSTGGRQDISVVAFSDSLHGIVAQVNDVGTLMVNTSDGGLTWTTVTPSGPFYAGDITGVPGTNIFVSGGSNANGFGTSFSIDNGLSWIFIDTIASHTSMDFLDINTGFGGEYITLGSPGGAWKFAGYLDTVPCGSSLANSGTLICDTLICYNDTLVLNMTGTYTPTDGVLHGFGYIVSDSDLGGSNDPLSLPGILGGFAPNNSITGSNFYSNPLLFINDGVQLPAGIYYFTPVVYGNATGSSDAAITTYVLDPTCTYTGVSVMVNMLVDGDPLCTSAISDLEASQYKMNAFFNSDMNIDVVINSSLNGKTNLSIYDVTGRNVFTDNFNATQGVNHQVINVGNLGAGAYIIKAQTGSTTATSKLVKVQ